MDVPEITKPLKQPYVERQLIVVADDAVVKASREEALKEVQSNNTIDWMKIATLAIKTAVGLGGDLITLVAKEAYEAWSRARQNGIDVVQISKSEAATITFPPGHPRDGILYIGHPAKPDVYYTTAEFHRMTFEHKFAEAVRLLMYLGATEISVEHIRGWSRDFSGGMSIPIPSADASVGVSGSRSASTKESILFKATLDGTDAPRLPPKTSWYHHEPTWQSIAEGRLEFGLREFALNVTYNDDYGVNAGLKAAISKAGLDVGGKFEDHVSTEWRILGKFRAKQSA
jgi:hypothetical protein